MYFNRTPPLLTSHKQAVLSEINKNREREGGGGRRREREGEERKIIMKNIIFFPLPAEADPRTACPPLLANETCQTPSL